jgi:hypothetical protein
MTSNDNNKCKQDIAKEELVVAAKRCRLLDDDNDSEDSSDESSEEMEVKTELKEVSLEESMNQSNSYEDKLM